MKKYILAPSILAADFADLGADIRKISDEGAEYVHIDVMDGVFVPSISFGFPVIQAIRPCTDKFFDVHLMITNPGRYIEETVKAGADGITVHYEACQEDLAEVLGRIRESGCKAAVSIKPKTPAEVLRPYLDMVDMILVMTVEPGFGGQKYIPESTAKIAELKSMLLETGHQHVLIEVDGGINKDTAETVLKAGADVLVGGTAVFKGDIAENIQYFRSLFEKYQETDR